MGLCLLLLRGLLFSLFADHRRQNLPGLLLSLGGLCWSSSWHSMIGAILVRFRLLFLRLIRLIKVMAEPDSLRYDPIFEDISVLSSWSDELDQLCWPSEGFLDKISSSSTLASAYYCISLLLSWYRLIDLRWTCSSCFAIYSFFFATSLLRAMNSWYLISQYLMNDVMLSSIIIPILTSRLIRTIKQHETPIMFLKP